MTPRLKRLLLILGALLVVGIGYWSTRPHPRPGSLIYQQVLSASERGDNLAAIALLRQAVITEPGNGEFRGELGTRLLHERQFEPALAELQAASFLDPGLPHVYCQLSECLVELRRREDALSTLNTAFEKSPGCAHALTVRGELYLRDDNLKAALDDFQRAAQLDPRSALAHQKVGYILFQTQQYEAARRAFEEGLKLAPAHPGTHLLLGQVLLRSGGDPNSVEQAREHLEAALLNNPEAWRAQVALGQLYLRHGDLVAARKAYEAALGTQPYLRDAHYGLSQVAAREGNSRGAARHRKYVEIAQRQQQERAELSARANARSSEPGPALRYVRLCLDGGGLKDAERTLSRLISEDPGLREARELRAELYEKLDDPERAGREAAIAHRLPRRRPFFVGSPPSR
jgi:tetratricopeptide (TPR) repeat protein